MAKTSKILLHGLSASGKSYSTATLFKLRDARPNQRVVYLCTEANAITGIERGLKAYNIKLEPNQLIYSVVRGKKKKVFGNEIQALSKYVKQSAQEAQKSDSSNMQKDKYTYFLDVLKGLESFKGIDYVTKEEVDIGNIGDLEEEDILILDGLTPIVHGIWQIVKGSRVVSQISDYQVVQYWLQTFTKDLIDLDCSLILLAHTDRQYDEVEKVEKLRVSLGAGSALASKYAGSFSDVIYAYCDNQGTRLWAGRKLGTETAARNYPEKDKLVPDFSLYNFFRDDGIN